MGRVNGERFRCQGPLSTFALSCTPLTLVFAIDSKFQEDFWQSVGRLLEQDPAVSASKKRWLDPMKISMVRTEQGILVKLKTNNEFTASFVREQLLSKITQASNQVLGQPCQIEVEADPEQDGSVALHNGLIPPSHFQNPPEMDPPRVLWGTQNLSSAPAAKVQIPSVHHNPFDQRYTFDTFVVGTSNQFAHASSYAVAENPARHYNPLFLYSPPGLGKTHLLQAIGNHILAKNPNTRVLFISAERFVNELIESIQHNKMTHFRNKFRDSYDVVLFDDIQFIAGKEKSEEEFFHTFNALHSSRRQIVMTCDCPPKQIQNLEERLRTRIEWGLIADIAAPDIETRIAILKNKAERDDIYLPDDVATFMATYIKSNVRELEGVLIKLQAHASLTGAELSIDLAKQQLNHLVPEQGSNFTIESVQAAVVKHYKLKSGDFKSSVKQRAVARPRQIAMFLIRKYTQMGFKEIGQIFGGRDHSTVMYACKEIERLVETDAKVKEDVEAIQNLL